MKIVLIVLLLVAFLLGAGYYGLPIVLEKETIGLKSEIGDLKERLQKAEVFIHNEEEARKVTQLQPDADVQKVIRSVNTVSSKMTSLENSFSKDLASTKEAMKKQTGATEETLKKQTEAIDKLSKETQTKLKKIMFDAKMANIRGHIAKARTDLLSRNIATAKTELELIDQVFETLKTSVTDENKKTIEELQSTVKKTRTEIDADLPSAINRIDLLWHEIGKLLRKG